jgi:hypothetical protein
VADSDVEIRSFRVVFALDRRIYQFDRFRLNPGGVPIRGIGYAVALVAAALGAGAVPVLSWPLHEMPWYFRDVAFPIGMAALLTVLRIEGRPFHLAAGALVRHRLGPRRFAGLRPWSGRRGVWLPPPITWIVDGSEAAPRSLRYRGPGVALVCYAHDRVEWSRSVGARRGADVSIHPIGEPGSGPAVAAALELASHAVLEISRHPLRWHGSQRS